LFLEAVRVAVAFASNVESREFQNDAADDRLYGPYRQSELWSVPVQSDTRRRSSGGRIASVHGNRHFRI
jgi:hypothetical protein